MSPFIYDELPDPEHCIRLIELQGDKDGDIRCEMSAHWLEKAPAYFAISYTWGSAAHTTTITINGKPKLVRHSCRYVLQQAHAYGASRYYWIDALCINQEGLTERSAQVQQMGRIFETAVHIHAGIGEHADDSPFVMSMLNTFPRVPLDPVTRLTLRATAFTRVVMWLLSHSKAMIRRLLQGFRALLTRPYFQRVWIIQEVFGKQYRTTLCCGEDRLSILIPFTLVRTLRAIAMNDSAERSSPLSWSFALEKLRSIANTFSGQRLAAIDSRHRFYDYPSASSSFLLAVSFAGQRDSNRSSGVTTKDGKDGLEEIVGMLRFFDCQDPRDRVYGTLSLVDWEGQAPITADYRKSTFEVMLEVLLRGWARDRYKTMRDVMELLLSFRTNSAGMDIAREILEYQNFNAKSVSLESSPRRALLGPWCEITNTDSTVLGTERKISVVLPADDHNDFYSDIRITMGLEAQVEGGISLHGLVLDHGSCGTEPVSDEISESSLYEVLLGPEDALVLAIMLSNSYQIDAASRSLDILGSLFCHSFSSSSGRPTRILQSRVDKTSLPLHTWRAIERERPLRDTELRLAWRVR